MTLKESALNYARQGFRVFPLAVNSKGIQVVRSWPKEATKDLETITKWWDINPNYNIGLALDENHLVIDIDKKNGVDGNVAISHWEKENGRCLKDTATAITGSGGMHLYYKINGSYKNKVGLYEGIDIRTSGGYVVAPPSVHENGVEYAWLSETIQEADESVYAFLKGAQQEIERMAPGEAKGETIPQGQRNDALYRLACSLQAKGLAKKAIINAVWIENNEKCQPPLSKEEVKALVNSALKKESGTSSYKGSVSTDTSLLKMSEVQEKEMEWLIPLYIPKGCINLLAGDGGVGKTTTWCSISSSVSSGTPCFFENVSDQKREPRKVIFFSSEDDPSYSLKKRLRLNGANMDNILTINISDDRFKDVKFNSPFLETLIRDNNPALLIFDPLQSYIPEDVNMGYRNSMRAMLNPLIGFGEKYGVTSLIMVHTNKRENASGRNRISDSSDIWDIARNVFIIGKADEGLRYLSHEKINNAVEQDTVLFSIVDGIPKYEGETYKKDKDFMSKKTYERKGKGAKEEAQEAILEYLDGGEKETADLDSYMKAISTSEGTLKRVKADLKKQGVITYRSTGQGKDKKHYIVANTTELDYEEMLK